MKPLRGEEPLTERLLALQGAAVPQRAAHDSEVRAALLPVALYLTAARRLAKKTLHGETWHTGGLALWLSERASSSAESVVGGSLPCA